MFCFDANFTAGRPKTPFICGLIKISARPTNNDALSFDDQMKFDGFKIGKN